MARPAQDEAQIAADAFQNGLKEAQSVSPPYADDRERLFHQESAFSWDQAAKNNASDIEVRAEKIVWKIREDERENHFGNKASEAIPGPETRDMGGQFLTNKDRIEDSKLWKIAQAMPKGGHLHLHFNAEIPPEILVEKARDVENMFIRSTTPILSEQDVADTEVVFSVMPTDTMEVDLFSPDYNPEFRKPGSTPWMRWSVFRPIFQENFGQDAEGWVINKMVLSPEEAYGIRQTTNGVWARFNQGTRCFKGLLNYGTIYRWYIGAAIDSMIKDKVMYAELRPMLLDKFIPTEDGQGKLFHADQMRILVEEVHKKQEQLKEAGELDKFPFGFKIIYCSPRSIPKEMMKKELQDCIKLKLEFPDLICGFDLVGAEDRPNHIGFYAEELQAFVKACEKLNISIPFMFHAGETLLDSGGSRTTENSNLYDAVLLNAKRIGHGYSLVKHPHLVQEFKKKNICIELCPTSNELLHLCRNIKEHVYPQLLALGIPCTVNSDNPSLFRGDCRSSSSVSHEFYQVMVGSPTMNLHGWKQLALWSLEYSCLGDREKAEAERIWRREFEAFCKWVVETYGKYADGLDL
ncbi:Metallo-dependent hydrolase [Aulographum hederae CBS 113979]|uniref:adenosine deaminase n=1 Tax=Aulographum hederae CBS 113979 TaxID=1176131 RepID=A0A6G1HAI2_9PEZI|nr:Metallo-dependent hydrolase [Aulographum hederae CBS 113979]